MSQHPGGNQACEMGTGAADPCTPSRLGRAFFAGLLLLSAATLMYEIVLTRLLSVVCWYYLAFVSVSMAMFGMTGGALFVQLRPTLFAKELLRVRLYQSVLAMAISMPVTLLLMLAIPLDISLAAQTAFSFLLFSSVIAVPFFFSGVAVCLSLTRMPFSMGRIYFVDLCGAALGCLCAVALLSLFDAPSAVFFISAILFASASAFADYAQRTGSQRKCLIGLVSMIVVAGLNTSTVHGIQPIWSKGKIDPREYILAEKWNSISKVRLYDAERTHPYLWGPSARTPDYNVIAMGLEIDNDASTQITYFNGDLSALSFLRYDVTSIAAPLRRGGSAAIIGVGGGRDVLNCAFNGFHRIVGIEVNSAIADITSRDLDWFTGFSKIPGFELHQDEGRSYLTRSGERFDLIQASFVDTWAATSAGAMTLSENSLYTVEGWRAFYEHLKPGGIITFSRWYRGPVKYETYRLFGVAYATLLSEGVSDPMSHLAVIQSGSVATLLASNQPFSAEDLASLKRASSEMGFTPLAMPGEPLAIPELKRISETKTVEAMGSLENESGMDYSPTFDSSPYFFNAIRLRTLPRFFSSYVVLPNLNAMWFLFAFFFAAIILVTATIALPAWMAYRRSSGNLPASGGGVAYFICLGLGFMCVEMAMMQQLSIFLGQPIYSMIVVLAGLILSAGAGSFASDFWPARSAWQCRIPPIASVLLVVLYFTLVLPVIHACDAAPLWQRAGICLLLISPSGFALGFCFPVGLRWMTGLSQQRNLPWMWALNGAAGTLGSFVAMLISMETSVGICVLTGAGFYLAAAVVLPRGISPPSSFPHSREDRKRASSIA
jgi:hypothetical protein